MIGTPPGRIKERFGNLVSKSVPCAGVSASTFLRHAEGQARFMWSSPDDERVLLGFGSALSLEAWGEDRFNDIEAQAKALFEDVEGREPKLFGGFAFSDAFSPENAWARFAPAQFVLPHFQLELTSNAATLSIHAGLQGEAPDETALYEALLSRRDALQAEPEQTAEQARLMSCRDLTSAGEWREMIERSQALMDTGGLKKVVLARVKEACFTETAKPLVALDTLNQNYSDCYRFLFEPQPGHAFLGATPELLVSVQGAELRTMALAASAPRGADKLEDERVAAELLTDPKETYEHRLVRERLMERLERFGSVKADALQILKLHNIQHLYTPVSATLTSQTGILPVVKVLHPTPALGGEPRELAGDLIAQLEPQARGWYGAPIGFIDSDLGGAFSVAIRSAVVQRERAWLFSGAGIVPDSVPEKEWRETALKFRPMLGAFDIALPEPESDLEAEHG